MTISASGAGGGNSASGSARSDWASASPKASPSRNAGRAERRGANVAGLLRGRQSPDRYIVMSAHYDHIGVEQGEIIEYIVATAQHHGVRLVTSATRIAAANIVSIVA